MSLLRIEKLVHEFGGLQAIKDYDLEMAPGQVRGLIGPNGAGKTTIFNLITGMYRPSKGRIIYDGKDIAGLKPYQIAS
ncbi:MAG: ATP-binding cassette domain-containing protein, partial [Pseudomonadota bacterium]